MRLESVQTKFKWSNVVVDKLQTSVKWLVGTLLISWHITFDSNKWSHIVTKLHFSGLKHVTELHFKLKTYSHQVECWISPFKLIFPQYGHDLSENDFVMILPFSFAVNFYLQVISVLNSAYDFSYKYSLFFFFFKSMLCNLCGYMLLFYW